MYWDAGTPIGSQVLQKTSSANAVNLSSPCHPQMDMFSESRAASVSKGSLGGSNHRENVPAINVPPSPPKIVSSNTPKVAGGYQTIATPRSQVLDLTRNDNSFHVIAKLIIDRFEDQLKLHADTITITAGDRFHLDRVVPTKKNFVEAVQYRLQNCSDQSTKPIHLVTRQCRALGLHFDGDRNILFAPVGTIIKIDWADGSLHAIVDSVQNARPSGPNDLARQQLLVELREASNLMAESVTPEASRFWRKHVLELQAKLRSLHDKGMEMNGETSRETKITDIRQNNEKLMASLWENTGYVPPKQEDMESSVSVSMNNSIVESKDPSRQHFELPTETQEAALPMVEVVAPADLPGGYQFEAEIDNKHFLASVPAGGVLKGQTFACTMRQMKESDVPVGRWKDGLFDCFRYGCTHPMLLNSLLCPLLALSQVEGRLGLDVMGRKASPDTPRTGLWSARGMMITVIVFWVCLNAMIISGFEYKLHNYVSPSPADIVSLVLVNGFMVLFAIYATANTRTFLREKYHIDEDINGSRTRDILETIFCLPLTISQMGRHTTSYEEYEGSCCNDTGIAQPRNSAGVMM